MHYERMIIIKLLDRDNREILNYQKKNKKILIAFKFRD